MRARAVVRTVPIMAIGFGGAGGPRHGRYLKVVRPWQLRLGATDDEVRRPMPGDEIVVRPTFNATRAVTVKAPPSIIWPWIVQIGFGRAGWYIYDLLDNFGWPSAKRIVPALQQLRVGDVIPIYQGRGAPEGVGLKVKAIEPERWMLWWDEKTEGTTWIWALYPANEQQTRLITRVRMRYRWTRPTILFSLLVEFADPVMMRRDVLTGDADKTNNDRTAGERGEGVFTGHQAAPGEHGRKAIAVAGLVTGCRDCRTNAE